jgi:hypothetical protein
VAHAFDTLHEEDEKFMKQDQWDMDTKMKQFLASYDEILVLMDRWWLHISKI